MKPPNLIGADEEFNSTSIPSEDLSMKACTKNATDRDSQC